MSNNSAFHEEAIFFTYLNAFAEQSEKSTGTSTKDISILNIPSKFHLHYKKKQQMKAHNPSL